MESNLMKLRLVSSLFKRVAVGHEGGNSCSPHMAFPNEQITCHVLFESCTLPSHIIREKAQLSNQLINFWKISHLCDRSKKQLKNQPTTVLF